MRFSQIVVLYNALIGYLIKFLIDIKLVRPYKRKDKRKDDLIVSLTSYGRRVEGVVYYTLISLLRQTQRPGKIILWLDKTRWNGNNIPNKIKNLYPYGVEVKYCEDIRSYKKLLYSILEYGRKTIITVDDDVIYKPNLIKKLVEAHFLHPRDIISGDARYPVAEKDKFLSYKYWINHGNYTEKKKYIMPVGESGVLYPPQSLYKDVTNYQLAKQLSPLADDLWFWVMSKLQGTDHIVIGKNKTAGYSFDAIYQFFHKGSALTHTNNGENQNDVQLQAIMDYYGIQPEALRETSSS
ncbi:MAG: glycosyltransferase family 2 protein [Muribaculaceae bacterium]|nr:glycosyltransferase family 2 protein [Muribaculaceae bacterium]